MRQTLKILGPPGTGKTERLLQLLEKELAHVAPNRVAFLTFTRAARLEALGRTGKTAEELPYVRTLHSVCYQKLGMTQDAMVRRSNLQDFGNLVGERLTGNQIDPWLQEELGQSWEPPTKNDELLRLNHLGRHRRIQLKEALLTTNYEWRYAKWFTEAYRTWKGAEGLVDYTDLLMGYLLGGEPLDIDVLFIDEAQDLSLLQWEVARRLGINAERIYLAGDDDQAIFEWAGASAQAFMDEPANQMEVLSQSYRLPGKVYDLAEGVVRRISRRLLKTYRPRNSEGQVGYSGTLLESDLMAASTFLLFRNHHRGPAWTRRLERLEVPFKGPGTLLGDPTIHDALVGWREGCLGKVLSWDQAKALLKFMPEEFTKVRRVPKVEKIRMGDLVWTIPPEENRWPVYLRKLPKLPYLEALERRHGFSELLAPRVELLSLHQSKGRQAETVLIDPEMAQRTWEGFNQDQDPEHRVFYVGVTRARQEVRVLLPEDPRHYPLRY